ncbi:MAG: hypothetical protein LDL39_18285 [Magnetospirillum sp.]|nr:hypothetical protein [Magnetospirillum sp.]
MFFAIRDGSGEEAKVIRTEGTNPPTNLNNGHRPNEWRQHGTGGNWLFPHGNWNE